MNEKLQYRTLRPRAVLKISSSLFSERAQINPDNSRAMTALTFLLFKLNILQKISSNFDSAEAMV